jgi:L-fucose isomerase-like protein
VNSEFRIAVFSPNDPRPWVRSENLDLMLDHEARLVDELRRRGYVVERGGEGMPREDQVAWSTSLVQEQVKRLADRKPAVLIVNQGSWTFPYDSIDAVKLLAKSTGDTPRVVMFSYKDTQVPGLVAGMAAGGGLKRIGIPFVACYGKIDEDSAVGDRLSEILDFYKARWEAVQVVQGALARLPFQKYLALGGMSLKMATTTADVDQWQKIFGISYEALDQSALTDRALAMVEWKGAPGESTYLVKDSRLAGAVSYLLEQGHGSFDFTRDGLRGPEKFILQLAFYYAALDLVEELGVTFAGIKCQDELSARYCTVCPAAAFLNNDVGPDGEAKRVVPVACENDMDSALSQLLLNLLSGQPAGFGDFRDVDNGVLAIVNCGQHPQYFFGAPGESAVAKLDRAEYLGQEFYYDAGGSSVRGRTPGRELMTVARLGRQNLRYELVATVVDTLDVDPGEHELYTPSWPIIKGKVPIGDEVLIEAWPCNHLAFTFGDWTAALAELAHRLDIGYRIFDRHGREFKKPA